MPLLLTRFSIGVPALPSLLEALPLAGCKPYKLGAVPRRGLAGACTLCTLRAAASYTAAHQPKTPEANTRERPGHIPEGFIRALPSLTSLTGLEIGPPLTIDANSCLPTSLVELKLEFSTTVRVEKKPRPQPHPQPEAAGSAHGSGADTEDEGWWSEAEGQEEDWEDEEEEEVTEAQYKAARQLDLTSLPFLQCCQVMRSHPIVYEDDDYPRRHDDCDLVTLRLATPHLTRLLLSCP